MTSWKKVKGEIKSDRKHKEREKPKKVKNNDNPTFEQIKLTVNG